MIIDGKSHSEKLRKKIKDELTKICQNTKDVPKLSVILIGDYLPSQIYVKNKQKKAKEVGIKSEVIKYPETVSEKEILNKIKSLNNDKIAIVCIGFLNGTNQASYFFKKYFA